MIPPEVMELRSTVCSRAWKTKGKVDWAGYKIKVEEKMDSFAVQMSCGRNWSARERYAMFLKHLNEAAEESLKRFITKGRCIQNVRNTLGGMRK